ncbi:hypothetical protein B0H14DRAFT_3726707 [Mycena olivaceomarginata]|nr:hypothetical protein B0H14DRAFT_3726707 [Mycena olivaceomarginata]
MPQDLSGTLLKSSPNPAPQELQEPHAARQSLAPQDFSGTLLKSAPNPRAARASRANMMRVKWETAQDVDACQVLAPQDLSGTLLKSAPILALQEPQEPHDAFLAPRDLRGTLLNQIHAPQDLSGDTAQDRAKSSRFKTSVRYCSRRAKSSRCKSLKSHMTRIKSRASRLSGILLKTRQILALQEPQEPHGRDVRQVLAH